MNKIFVSATEQLLFLYFITSIQTKTFIFKNVSLSVLIGTYNLRIFLKRFHDLYFKQNLSGSFITVPVLAMKFKPFDTMSSGENFSHKLSEAELFEGSAQQESDLIKPLTQLKIIQNRKALYFPNFGHFFPDS